MSETNTPSTSIEIERPYGQPITGVKHLLAAGKALGSAITPPEPCAPYAIVPDGFSLKELPRKQLAPLPDHIRQRVTLREAEGFISYVKSYATHATRIFGFAPQLDKVKIDAEEVAYFEAILDYHSGGKGDACPNRTAHIARYSIGLSFEFRVWLSSNQKPKQQMDFVSFIENNALDVVTPDSATLMEMAMNFEAKRDVNFQSKINRTTGGVNLAYQDEVELGGEKAGTLKVPDRMKIKVPIFEGGKAYEIDVRLEYRPTREGLFIIYHLQRPHKVYTEAMLHLRGEIAAELEREILMGYADLKERAVFNDEI